MARSLDPRTRLAAVAAWFGRPESKGLFLLLLFFVAIAPLKFELTLAVKDPGIDGGFYTQVAQHVRDGNGLVSSVSWYHHGYPYFPHPTSIYPVWPLIYGFLGRLFPLVEGGIWFNTCLYFITLTLGYLWANKAFPGPLVRWLPPALNAGHLFVLILGLHERYMRATSMPYTEGIAYALILGFLWYSHDRWRRPTPGAGLVMGVLLGLIFLSRFQLIIVPLAAVLTFGWALVNASSRRAVLAMAGASAVGFFVVVGPFLVYVSSFLVGGVTSLFPFSRARVTDLLTPQDVKHVGSSFLHVVIDRLGGLWVAFRPDSKWALPRVYGLTAYTAVVALPYAALLGLRARRRRQQGLAWRWLRQPENLPYVFLVIFATAGFFHLLLIHKGFSHPWYFARRQGLPGVFFIYGCALFLFRVRVRGAAPVALALLIAGSVHAWQRCEANLAGQTASYRLDYPRADQGDPTSRYDTVANWLDRKRAERGEFTAVIRSPWRYAHRTHGVGYHGIGSSTRYRDIEVLFDELGADVILVAPSERKRSWFRARTFHARFEATGERLDVYQVFALRTDQAKPAPPPIAK